MAAATVISRTNVKTNKHSDACNYLPPYKLDVLNIVEYRFSCEMEAHVEVTISTRYFNVCVPMSINEFVEMAIFLWLIRFSIYDKMQGFIDESVFFF